MARNKRAKQLAKEKNRVKRTKEEWEAMKRENPDLGQKKGYHLAPKSNEMFERYYRGIGIVPEEEWDDFLNTMRRPLPTTFRVTGSRRQAEELLKIIKGQYFSKFFSTDDDQEKIVPTQLPWYPNGLAWQLDFTRKEIKNDSALKSLHGFLISETESLYREEEAEYVLKLVSENQDLVRDKSVKSQGILFHQGNISRQEAVSMLPPLLMDIKPHHKILDMCAAPGSKTAQLIEALHSDENVPTPEGFVVANDADNKRCYLMTHQVKRLQSPNCMIVNHDARILPNMFYSKDNNADVVKYDRILCDVPCSGDGTMRKNPDIWSKWHVNGGYNLHSVQKKILQRGLELLAVGGRLVYSTCSLNPMEDEAVILTILNMCGGAVELVDVSDKLTGLKYSKGTYSWKCMNKTGEWYETEEMASKQFRNQWDTTIYPPIITVAQEAKLERCIRVLPHQNNTGAFFIAVLEKTRDLPWTSGKSNRNADPIINPSERQDSSEKKQSQSQHFTFGIRGKNGSYHFAKCKLCGVMLQGRNDFNSHQGGRKHKQSLEDYEQTKKTGPVASTDPAVPVKSDTVAMDTEPAKPTEHASKTDTYSSVADPEKPTNDCEQTTGEDTVASGVTEVTARKVRDEPEVTEEREVTGEPGVTDTAVEPNGKDSPPTKRQKMEKGETTEEKKETEQKKEMEEKTKPEEIKEATRQSGIPVMVHGHKEDPFIFCTKDDPIWPPIKEFYGIGESMCVEQIMYRNMKRMLYYVTEQVRDLVVANNERVKFINMGVKCFSSGPSPLVTECDYRLSQEGLHVIEKYVSGRRISMTRQDVVTILSCENPFIYKLSPSTQDSVHTIAPGSVIFHCVPSESDPEPCVEILFCGWRGKTSVRSFVDKDQRQHYLRMCGVELSDIKAQVKMMKEGKNLLEATPNSSQVSGTETPVGPASGDEAEVEKWNEEAEAPRDPEADEVEEEEINGDLAVESEMLNTDNDKANDNNEAGIDNEENMEDDVAESAE